jgi:hypothetical protein
VVIRPAVPSDVPGVGDKWGQRLDLVLMPLELDQPTD